MLVKETLNTKNYLSTKAKITGSREPVCMLSTLRLLMFKTDDSVWITCQGSFPFRKQILPFQKSLMVCTIISKVENCPITPFMLTCQLLSLYRAYLCSHIVEICWKQFLCHFQSTVSCCRRPTFCTTFIQQIGTNMDK